MNNLKKILQMVVDYYNEVGCGHVHNGLLCVCTVVERKKPLLYVRAGLRVLIVSLWEL